MRFRPGRKSALKAFTVFAGTDKTIELAKKYKLKTAWGTDILFSQTAGAAPGRIAGQVHAVVHAGGNAHHGNRDKRRAAGDVRQAQPLSGQARRYRRRARSLTFCWSMAIRIADIKLLQDPAKNLVVIMKDGRIFKNAQLACAWFRV